MRKKAFFSFTPLEGPVRKGGDEDFLNKRFGLGLKSHPNLLMGFIVLLLVLVSGCAGAKERRREDAKIYLKVGATYLKQGRIDSALKDLMEAERLNPDDPEIHYNLGLAYYQKEKFDEAIAYYQKALELNPEFSLARNNLGVVYLQLGRWDSAIAEFEEAVADMFYPTPELAHNNIGWAYYKKKEFLRAIECYKKSLKLNPRLSLAYNNLGRAYYDLDRIKDATYEFKLAIKYYPAYTEAHLNLGLAYLKLNRKQEAISEFNEVLKLAPDGEYRRKTQRYLDLLKSR